MQLVDGLPVDSEFEICCGNSTSLPLHQEVPMTLRWTVGLRHFDGEITFDIPASGGRVRIGLSGILAGSRLTFRTRLSVLFTTLNFLQFHGGCPNREFGTMYQASNLPIDIDVAIFPRTRCIRNEWVVCRGIPGQCCAAENGTATDSRLFQYVSSSEFVFVYRWWWSSLTLFALDILRRDHCHIQ